MTEKMDKYLEIAENYGMQDIKEFAKSREKTITNIPFTVGIIGNQFKLLTFLAELTGITELKGLRAYRSFSMEITEGKDTACFCLDEQKKRRISFEEMRSSMEASTLLESEERLPLFSISLTVVDWKLKGVRLLVIGSVCNYEDVSLEKMMFEMDRCCMVLSATRLLAMEERKLIKKYKNNIHIYILADMKQVNKENQDAVNRQLLSFVGENGGMVVRDDQEEALQKLREMWEGENRNEKETVRRRTEALEEAVHRRLIDHLEKAESVYRYDEKKIQDMIGHLAKAYEELPSYKERTTRYIQMYYLEEIKLEMESELLRFDTELQADIRAGIEEEKDIKQLQDTLAGYIMGEWENFLSGTLQSRMENAAYRMDGEIENCIQQNVEDLLCMHLSADEYKELEKLLEMQFGNSGISIRGDGMEMDENEILFDAGEKKTFYGLLPKCVMAAGGVAILCSAFLPGALMLCAGYKMNISAGEAAKEKLLQEGGKMTKQCMEEVRKKLQEAFENMQKSTEELVSDCYDTVMNRLITILEDFRKNDADKKEKAMKIERDLEKLGRTKEEKCYEY